MKTDALLEDSIFIEVFGGSPITRVLDFLITFADFDYPLSCVGIHAACLLERIQHPDDSDQFIDFTHTGSRNDIHYPCRANRPIDRRRSVFLQRSGRDAFPISRVVGNSSRDTCRRSFRFSQWDNPSVS